MRGRFDVGAMFISCGCVVVSLLAPAFASTGPEGSSASKTERYQGMASDPRTNAPLYTEEHQLSFRNGRLETVETTYSGSDKKFWGTLKTRPTRADDFFTYRFEDARSGQVHGVDVAEGNRVTMFRKTSAKEKMEKEDYTLEKGAPTTVAGQGFHFYLSSLIRQAKLKPGDEHKIRLLLPGRFDYYTFRIRVESQEKGLLKCHLEFDNMFLRFFGGVSMKLVYEEKSGRLMEYVGPTHLDDNEGDLIELVRVVYRYAEDRAE